MIMRDGSVPQSHKEKQANKKHQIKQETSRPKKQVLKTGREEKKETQRSNRRLLRVEHENKRKTRSKRNLLRTDRRKSEEESHHKRKQMHNKQGKNVRTRTKKISLTEQRVMTSRFKRAPRRLHLRKPKIKNRKQDGDDDYEDTTVVNVRTTTRKKITDKERIPVFMFMIKMLDFVLRIIS